MLPPREARLEIVQDSFGALGARVVRREDDDVRVAGHRLRHRGPLGAIAIATRSEQDDQPSFPELPYGAQHSLERGRGVGEVDHDGERLGADHFQPARHLAGPLEPRDDLVERESERRRGGRGRQSVLDVVAAEQRKSHRTPLVTHAKNE